MEKTFTIEKDGTTKLILVSPKLKHLGEYSKVYTQILYVEPQTNVWFWGKDKRAKLTEGIYPYIPLIVQLNNSYNNISAVSNLEDITQFSLIEEFAYLIRTGLIKREFTYQYENDLHKLQISKLLKQFGMDWNEVGTQYTNYYVFSLYPGLNKFFSDCKLVLEHFEPQYYAKSYGISLSERMLLSAGGIIPDIYIEHLIEDSNG
jgi:hypothetical protein